MNGKRIDFEWILILIQWLGLTRWSHQLVPFIFSERTGGFERWENHQSKYSVFDCQMIQMTMWFSMFHVYASCHFRDTAHLNLEMFTWFFAFFRDKIQYLVWLISILVILKRYRQTFQRSFSQLPYNFNPCWIVRYINTQPIMHIYIYMYTRSRL